MSTIDCGEALRTIRNDRLRMTQAEVARALGVSLRTYQLIEGDARPPSRSYQMAVHMLSLTEAVARRDESVATTQAGDTAKAFGLLSEVRAALDRMLGRSGV